jgi:hypothetical protein
MLRQPASSLHEASLKWLTLFDDLLDFRSSILSILCEDAAEQPATLHTFASGGSSPGRMYLLLLLSLKHCLNG